MGRISVTSDVEILRLQANVFAVSGLENESQRIDNRRLTCIVLSHERSNAPVELNKQTLLVCAKLPEILNFEC
ncbi:hypothetical protein D3C71_1907410 [compost metagenome]